MYIYIYKCEYIERDDFVQIEMLLFTNNTRQCHNPEDHYLNT